MLRPGLVSCWRLLIAYAVLFIGCAEELDLEPPLPPVGTEGAPVEALFDPTNPIPVLRFVPVPTILAQEPDGTLDEESVTPAECERPTASQCLALGDYWPTSTPITLQFSGEVNLDTVAEGIEVYEVGADGQLIRVPVVASQVERAPPGPDTTADPTASPSACEQAFGYPSSAVVAGYDVILVPEEDAIPTTSSRDLKVQTQYVVLVKSSEQGGLRDVNGDPIEPSGLFFLLNTDDEPVTEDGDIPSALLRSQVQGSVLAAAFGGALIEDLTEEQINQLNGLVRTAGLDLYDLYQLFEGLLGLAVANGVVTDRSELVLMNTWTTGLPAPVFDPTAARVPFPNSELLLAPDEQGVFRVSLPAAGAGPIPPELVPGLNKLDGFSLRTPPAGPFPETGPVMLFETETPVDLNSAADGIVMIPLDAEGQPQAPVPLNVTSTTGVSIIVQPVSPLDPGTTYLVAVTTDLKRSDDGDFVPPAIFELLKSPLPLVDGSTVAPAVVPALQCAPLLAGGSALAAPEEVAALGGQHEALRARWQSTFEALEAASIPRTEVLLAWSYTTQSITGDVDGFRDALFTGDFDNDMPRVTATGQRFEGSAAIAQLLNIVDGQCVPLCQAGDLPGLSPDACVDNQGMATPEVAANAVCQLIIALTTSDLGAAELFSMRSHPVTEGNPFVDGTFNLARLQSPETGSLPVWLVTPSAPAPAAGYPVVIFQHGLGRFKEDGFQLVNRFAQAGWAMVMMDLPWHGARASDLTTLVDVPGLGMSEVPCEDPVDPTAVTCDAAGACDNGCDGTQDMSGTGFLSANFAAVRDNYRQTTIDQLTLVHTIITESAAGGAWSELDPARISYVGQSFGGINGSNLLAYIDDGQIDTAVLNVTGGDLSLLLQTSILAVPINVALNQAGVCQYVEANNPASGCELTEAFLGLLALADWSIQAGDPAQTAPAVTQRFGAENILMQIASPDLLVPNVTSESLRDRLGLGGTDQYQVYDFSALPEATVGFGCHGFLLAPICGACLEDALCTTLGSQIQSVDFIGSEGVTIRDQVSDVPGLSCMDPCAAQ